MKRESLPEESTVGGLFENLSPNRKLFFHDSVAFLFLFLLTVVLYAATSFLFRSFSNRRADLAKEFSERGKQALQQNNPEEAIRALRTALEYSPGGHGDDFLIAEALAAGHHTDEAIDYFLNLREAEPASGFVNLELARLYREKKDSAKAIDSYRAASLGIWDNNGIQERLKVEIELAQYLIERNNLGGARLELLMAAQNVPESAPTEIVLGDKLLKADDPAGALASYKQAVQWEPHNGEALAKAGTILYQMGRYAEARHTIELAMDEHPSPAQAQQLAAFAENAAGFLRLSVSKELPAAERAQHIRADADIAKHRLDACVGTPRATGLPASLQDVASRWKSFRFRNGFDEDVAVQLIFDTETTTAQICGEPHGDDALLLQMASSAQEKQ